MDDTTKLRWRQQAADAADATYRKLSDMAPVENLDELVQVDAEAAVGTNSLDVEYFESLVAMKHLERGFLRDADTSKSF